MELKITRTQNPMQKPTDESALGFGKIFADHMFVMDYNTENGWHNAQICPFGPISMSPAATCLHYGQEVFEGLKAYRAADGSVKLFRPEENLKRMNISGERVSIPAFDEAFMLDALKELIALDADWVPHSNGASLYIRPFIIGVEDSLGAHASHKYKLMIITSPSGAYYASGLNPVKIFVETEFVRSVVGGTGYAKTGGNYAASFKAQDVAGAEGYSQVLWLDGVERRYIEEVGAMNVFFVIGDEVVTPALSGSILSGITRKSAIDIMRSWGLHVTERKIDIQELLDAHKNGQLKEAFGTGTAAVISPIGVIKYKDTVMTINDNLIGETSQRLYDTLTGIQYANLDDPFGWVVSVN